MSLPPAAPARQLKHRRQIDVQVFVRGNGLWEVDARLTDIDANADVDTESRDLSVANGARPAGTPSHDRLLRLAIHEQFDRLEASLCRANTRHLRRQTVTLPDLIERASEDNR